MRNLVLPTLAPFDEPLANALDAGHIRLLSADALRSGALTSLSRRQDLEERERAGGAALLLPPADAADALRAADRRICFLTHPWRTHVNPDPDGATHAALLRFLRDPLGADIVAVFVDYSCVHQPPRTTEQEASFKAALGVVAFAFASPLGTTVARFADMPPCPTGLVATVAIVGASGRHVRARKRHFRWFCSDL